MVTATNLNQIVNMRIENYHVMAILDYLQLENHLQYFQKFNCQFLNFNICL